MKNWKTSLIGIVLMLSGLYTGITTGVWSEAAVIIGIGVGFLVSKDYDKTGTK